jgi:hypothetical protein
MPLLLRCWPTPLDAKWQRPVPFKPFHALSPQDGQQYAVDEVLRASGGPLLGLELAGPNLMVYGAFFVEGNVVAAEPLTPRIPLLDLGERQLQHTELLVRVLAGYEAAVRLLSWRYNVMAASAPTVSVCCTPPRCLCFAHRAGCEQAGCSPSVNLTLRKPHPLSSRLCHRP